MRLKRVNYIKEWKNKHKFIIEMLRPKMNYWVFAIGTEHNGVFGDDCERLQETI